METLHSDACLLCTLTWVANSGCRPVVMVPDPNLDASLCQEADQVLTSLLEFDPTHWGLPPFSSCSSSKTNHLESHQGFMPS